MNKFEDDPAENFLYLISQNSLGGRTDENDLAVHIELHEQVTTIFNERTKPFLPLEDDLSRTLDLGCADQTACLIFDGRNGQRHIDDRAVLTPALGFEMIHAL